MKNEAVSAAQKQLRDKERKKKVLDLRLFEDGKSLDQMCKKW